MGTNGMSQSLLVFAHFKSSNQLESLAEEREQELYSFLSLAHPRSLGGGEGALETLECYRRKSWSEKKKERRMSHKESHPPPCPHMHTHALALMEGGHGFIDFAVGWALSFQLPEWSHPPEDLCSFSQCDDLLDSLI